MKVIFLDFDGVLNSAKYVAACGEYGVVIDPSRMVLLKKIVEATKAVIVLSTSWREYWFKDPALCSSTGKQIHDIFAAYGLRIFDKTPRLHMRRETEIRCWLNQHRTVERFVVLDDALLSADFLEGHFVKTSNYFDGLDDRDVQQAIRILNDHSQE